MLSPTSIARWEVVFPLHSFTFTMAEPPHPCNGDEDVGVDELKRKLHLFWHNSERLEFSFKLFYATISLMLTWLGPLTGLIH